MKLLNEFMIKGSPSTVTAQQKGLKIIRGTPIFYEKPEVTKAKNLIKSELIFKAPEEPYEGPLCVRIMWLFDKKTLTKKENKTFKVSYPDLDNMAKGFLDICTELHIWKDDNCISKLELEKAWCREFQGTFVQIWQMEEHDFDTYVLGWRDRVT